MDNHLSPKAMAVTLRARLAESDVTITHSRALEIVAAQLGFRDWNTCAAASESFSDPITVPIVRTFPGDEADRFYLDFLGFGVDWEHRFEPGMPLYRQVSRHGCVLHLSEHHGDATPGCAVRIRVRDAAALQRRLHDSTIYPLRIGLVHEPGRDEVRVPDPFGNRLIFFTPTGQ
ncbi:glyoxalase superfamily protein [Gordonia sp. L191]|uniref:glyoxalase superfamily protein n=1 Tax=Gordonia sp. L191 TaxID=2982699 RepID=UPI0024C02660|nr:glyoxalase superfamily protein [Gordonia sp. L191]WHU45409.1 glyoxalase superfamily protein [Gordonia sp. L191]